MEYYGDDMKISSNLLIDKNFEKTIDTFLLSNRKSMIFLLGSRGSGKTSYLRFIYEKFYETTTFDKLIFVSLMKIRNLKEFDLLFQKELGVIFKNNYKDSKILNVKSSIFREKMRKQSSLILLDNIDEIRPKLRKEIFERIQLYYDGLNNHSKIVITGNEFSVTKSFIDNKTIEINTISIKMPKLSKSYYEKYITKRYGLDKDSKKQIHLNHILSFVNESKFTWFTFDRLFHLLSSLDEKMLSQISFEGAESFEDFLHLIIADIWNKCSFRSQEIIKALILFEDIVKINELSILIDIDEEGFLDSLNELNRLGITYLTGNILSFSHKSLKDLIIIYLEEQNRRMISKPLNIYFDLNEVSKEEAVKLLSIINNIYKSLGGDELIITDSELGEFESTKEKVKI